MFMKTFIILTLLLSIRKKCLTDKMSCHWWNFNLISLFLSSFRMSIRKNVQGAWINMVCRFRSTLWRHVLHKMWMRTGKSHYVIKSVITVLKFLKKKSSRPNPLWNNNTRPLITVISLFFTLSYLRRVLQIILLLFSSFKLFYHNQLNDLFNLRWKKNVYVVR